MYRDNAVAVVVPAYNEEGFVGDTIETMPDFVDRVYVVDDCSTDGTWEEILQAAERTNKRRERAQPIADGGGTVGSVVVPIRHEVNTGVGGAIKTGYRRALADDMDVAAVMNGDGQMDPDILDRIVDPIVSGRADYAKGNRLASPEHRRGMPAFRTFGNFALSYLTKVASGYWRLLDPQNGYTAISRHALETLELDELYDRYGFVNHILIRCNAAGLRVADVPMNARYGDERSHIRLSSFVPDVSRLLAKGMVWRLRTRYLVFDFHPLIACFPLGFLGLVVGLLGAVAVTLGVGISGPDDAVLAQTLVIALVGLSGLLLSVGVLLDRHAGEALWTEVGES
jgi:glycosyltransferase involved in cell wall biosynthesis